MKNKIAKKEGNIRKVEKSIEYNKKAGRIPKDRDDSSEMSFSDTLTERRSRGSKKQSDLVGAA